MPGASLSAEVVEQTTKVETPGASHLLPMSSNSIGMSAGMNAIGPATGSPTPVDHSKAIEALAIIIGIRNASPSPLIFESGRTKKGGPTLELTQQAKDSLSVIFEEFASEAGLMSQKDIIRYMSICKGCAITQQKLSHLLNKYGSGPDCLSLEGFLDYYKDMCQTIEVEASVKEN
jgi:hypothetical protein